MASSSKKRTTMAKLNREQKLREKRIEKQARKEARRAAAQSTVSESHAGTADVTGPEASDQAVEPVEVDEAVEAPADAPARSV